MIRLRRVYQGAPGDGSHTVLVDRLWPRGVRKETLAPDEWRKDVLVAASRGDVTLLFAARDLEHNHAIVLKEYLDQLLAGHQGGGQ